MDDYLIHDSRQLNFVSKVYKWLSNTLCIQVHCLLCRANTTWKQPVCQLCLESCPFPHSFCSICGLPVTCNTIEVCAQCQQQPPCFDLCLSGYLYEFPVNRIVQNIKYNGRLELIRPITRQLTDILQDYYSDSPWPEAIIPVPLHKRRLYQRGYDQALLIAREIYTQLRQTCNFSLDIHCLKRKIATRTQQGLDARARRKNLRNAFTMDDKAGYTHVALIDDVVTTGETVSEISRLLKKHQVQRVDVWSLARTPAPK